jgi:hypothetical protein
MSLAFAKGYCDLNIPIDSDVSPLNLVKRAISFGYETLALNIRVHQKELIRKKSLQKHEAKKVIVCDLYFLYVFSFWSIIPHSISENPAKSI